MTAKFLLRVRGMAKAAPYGTAFEHVSNFESISLKAFFRALSSLSFLATPFL